MKGSDAPQWLDPQGLATEIIGNVIWLFAFTVPVILARYAYVYITRHLRLGLTPKLVISAAIVFGLLLIVVEKDRWAFVAMAFLALLLAGALSLRGLISAGVADAFRTTEAGVDYAASLRMAHTSIAFLGIGGDKLTSTTEFEPAMQRCATGGRTARFLLSDPDNRLLEQLARNNGTAPEAYKDRVITSLRVLAALQRNRSFNIEVRFYPDTNTRDLQQFRLMFINSAFCLLSWTVWGPHLGRRNPQLILKSRRPGAPWTLYKAFEDYFDEVWSDARPVDLGRYI